MAQRMVALHAGSTDDQILDLSPKLKLDINTVLGQQIAMFGVPGSGKTNAAALFIEQIGLFPIPTVIFDKEGDYLSLVEMLPRGILGTRSNCPTGYDVLNQGLQVVYDLSSWGHDDTRAELICTIIGQLMDWANDRPSHERVPCLIVLDEAHHWLPQVRGQNMAPNRFKSLFDTFHDVGSMGRKRGLTPVLICPKISELAKSVLYPGIYAFFRATLDTDVERYCKFIQNSNLTKQGLRQFIKELPTGKAVVILADGKQMTVRFHERQSEHTSHTPGVQAALNRYADIPFVAQQSFGGFLVPDETVAPVATPVHIVRMPVAKDPRDTPAFARVKEVLASNPDISNKQLGIQARCPWNMIKTYRALATQE